MSKELRQGIDGISRFVLVLLLMFVFLTAIKLLETAFKTVGEEQAISLVNSVTNPFAGLAVGVLATVLFQSSSVTTATIVGLVGSGTVPLSVAVPMIMGANIGTTITNTLVSLGHVREKDEFKRAFAGATVHDFFNLLTVAILFPLEQWTGFLQKAATMVAGVLPVGDVGGKFNSPFKTAVKAAAKQVIQLIEWGLEKTEGLLVLIFPIRAGIVDSKPALAIVLLVVALVMILASLFFITKNMKLLMANRMEEWLNRVLTQSRLLGLGIGIVITVSVQSSSITTSLLIPMFGAGLLRIEAGFPIMVGANLGTTVTAFIAALVTDVAGLTIALVHLFFNICGTLMFFPFERMRRIPIFLAEWLAERASYNRLWVIGYIVVVFVVIPGLGILVF